MRFFIAVFLLMTVSVFADKITVQTIACKSEKVFSELPTEVLKDEIQMINFAAKHQCVVLSESDRIQVVQKDPDSSELPYLRIVLQRTGEHYFVPRRSVTIEQPGQQNRFTF